MPVRQGQNNSHKTFNKTNICHEIIIYMILSISNREFKKKKIFYMYCLTHVNPIFLLMKAEMNSIREPKSILSSLKKCFPCDFCLRDICYCEIGVKWLNKIHCENLKRGEPETQGKIDPNGMSDQLCVTCFTRFYKS